MSFKEFGERLLALREVAGREPALETNRTLVATLETLEASLEEGSRLATALRPSLRSLLLRGADGGPQVLPTRHGWLYYRAAVDHITGPGFLDPSWLRQRNRDRAGIEADPTKAILDFSQQLDGLGVHLVVLPVPGKASLHPEALAPQAALGLRNPSFARWRSQLESRGVVVVDPLPTLLALRESGVEAFLRRDTHWQPVAMEATAELLARRLAAQGIAASGATRPQRTAPHRVAHAGDLVPMLGLDRPWWPSQEVEVTPVRDAIVPSAAVLLLGDSFTNVFSDPTLGWGANAGLAEQLAADIGLPVQRIARNAGGPQASRQELNALLERRPEALATTRVVVWQFAERELSFGDWKVE